MSVGTYRNSHSTDYCVDFVLGARTIPDFFYIYWHLVSGQTNCFCGIFVIARRNAGDQTHKGSRVCEDFTHHSQRAGGAQGALGRLLDSHTRRTAIDS